MKKVKLSLNYSFVCEPRDIYIALIKPDFMQNWFADSVELDKELGVYTFHWNSSVESAKIESSRTNEFVKYKWLDPDREPEEYLSFRIEVHSDDGWLDLHIEDFCDPGGEDSQRELWDEQMELLEGVIR